MEKIDLTRKEVEDLIDLVEFWDTDSDSEELRKNDLLKKLRVA